jgi:hypothetical protein
MGSQQENHHLRSRLSARRRSILPESDLTGQHHHDVVTSGYRIDATLDNDYYPSIALRKMLPDSRIGQCEQLDRVACRHHDHNNRRSARISDKQAVARQPHER